MDDEDAIDIPEGQCNIVFNNVSFGYVPEQLALDRVSFTVKPGETVALVRIFIYRVINEYMSNLFCL